MCVENTIHTFTFTITPLISTLYLFDGPLLQMFLHRLLDEKLLLLNLHPRVLFHDIFQDRLVRDSSLAITRLQRQRTKNSDAFLHQAKWNQCARLLGGRVTCYAP